MLRVGILRYYSETIWEMAELYFLCSSKGKFRKRSEGEQCRPSITQPLPSKGSLHTAASYFNSIIIPPTPQIARHHGLMNYTFHFHLLTLGLGSHCQGRPIQCSLGYIYKRYRPIHVASGDLQLSAFGFVY